MCTTEVIKIQIKKNQTNTLSKIYILCFFTFFSTYLLYIITQILHHSNAMLLSNPSIVSIKGYNELVIIGGSILFGFISALLGVYLSKSEVKHEIG